MTNQEAQLAIEAIRQLRRVLLKLFGVPDDLLSDVTTPNWKLVYDLADAARRARAELQVPLRLVTDTLRAAVEGDSSAAVWREVAGWVHSPNSPLELQLRDALATKFLRVPEDLRLLLAGFFAGLAMLHDANRVELMLTWAQSDDDTKGEHTTMNHKGRT